MKDRRLQSNPIQPSNGDGAASEQEPILSPKRERQLQQRVHQLEAIFANLPDAVIVTDVHGAILSTNLDAARLLGKAPGNVAPDRWPEELGFFLDDGETHYPGQRMPVVRALQGETVASEEMVLKPDRAGKGIWVSVSARPLLSPEGDIAGAVVVFRDISYRKQIELSREKHIQRAEALYRLSKNIAEVGDDVLQVLNTAVIHAAEMVGDACVAYLVDQDATRIDAVASFHANPAARASLRELMLSRSDSLDDSVVRGVVRSGEPLVIPSLAPQQLAAITAPGIAKYIQTVGIDSILVVPLKGRNRVLGTLGLSRDAGRPAYTSDEQSFLEDIARRTALAVENCKLFDSLRSQVSERLGAERLLRESEERLRSIFEGSALGIKVLDPEGVILQTNPALQSYVGRSAEEMSGRHFTDFVHPEDVEMSKHHLENMLCDRLDKTYLDHRLMSKDGAVVWVRGTFAAVKDADGPDGEEDVRFIVVMVENITESKKVNSELLETKARLLTQVEMERLRLAQELHDGPMQELHSVIYQFGGWREKLLPENRALLDEARDMIIKVIQELRSTAKDLRPPTIMDFGLEKAIRSHVEEFKDKHPELNIHLALTSDRQLLSEGVRLALFRIYQQALMNVVRHANAKNVNVRFTLDADEVNLEVEDDGKGFVVPSRWITLTRQGHFGLAGSAERVETLGGDLKVYSEPGKGARLVARIPIEVGQLES